MRTSLVRVPRGWVVPAILCTLLTVGCSSVSGSAVGVGASATALSSPIAPSTLPGDPGPAGSEPDPGPATTEPATTEPATTEPATTEPPSSSAATPATPPTSRSAPSTASGLVSVDHFWSPSRNIGCLIEEGLSVRCDLVESAITEKHDCHGTGDWGQSVALNRGQRAAMLCVSDTVQDPAAPVLAYGSSTRVGSITCTSSQDGIRCTDDLGHGFRLSRASYDVR